MQGESELWVAMWNHDCDDLMRQLEVQPLLGQSRTCAEHADNATRVEQCDLEVMPCVCGFELRCGVESSCRIGEAREHREELHVHILGPKMRTQYNPERSSYRVLGDCRAVLRYITYRISYILLPEGGVWIF